MGSLLSIIGNSKSLNIEGIINDSAFVPPPRNPNAGDNFNNIFFVNSKNGNRISYMHFKPKNTNLGHKNKKCIIFSHGNGCDIFTMHDYLMQLYYNLNIDIICYDYQGYGLSEGVPSEQNCYDDITVIVDECKNKLGFEKKNLILVGQSLGTAIVVDYIYKNEWEFPVMLISPFKSIISIVYDSSLLNYFDRFKSLEKIKNVHCPVKILHGEKDKLIAISHAKTLYRALNNKSLLPVWFANADHINILGYVSIEHFQELF